MLAAAGTPAVLWPATPWFSAAIHTASLTLPRLSGDELTEEECFGVAIVFGVRVQEQGSASISREQAHCY